MAGTLSTFDAVLKNQYTVPVQEQFNNDTILMKRFKKRKDMTQGKNFIIPVHTGRNTGVGSRGEMEDLPNAGDQGYKETIVPQRYFYGRIQVSGQTIKAARNDAGAFVRAVSSEIQGVTTDLKKDINRQLFGSQTGVLATTAAVTSAATVGVSSILYLFEGMRVDVRTSAGADISLNRVIQSINESAMTITLDAAVTTTATSILVRQGSYNKEMSGLTQIVNDTGALQNLNPATAGESIWKSYVNANGGTARAISEDLLRVTKDRARREGGQTSLIMSNLGVQAAYVKLLQADRRFINENVMNLDGGFKALDFDGIAWATDVDCPTGTVFFIDEKNIILPEMSSIEWMEEDGAILQRVQGKDAYEASLFWYANLATKRRNAHAKLVDITEPAGYIK